MQEALMLLPALIQAHTSVEAWRQGFAAGYTVDLLVGTSPAARVALLASELKRLGPRRFSLSAVSKAAISTRSMCGCVCGLVMRSPAHGPTMLFLLSDSAQLTAGAARWSTGGPHRS